MDTNATPSTTTNESWQEAVRTAGTLALNFSNGDGGWFHFNADGKLTQGKHPESSEHIDNAVMLYDVLAFDTSDETAWENWYADWRVRNMLDAAPGTVPAEVDFALNQPPEGFFEEEDEDGFDDDEEDEELDDDDAEEA